MRPFRLTHYFIAVCCTLVTAVTNGAETPGLVDGKMVAYEETIPGTDVTFTMVPAPAGEFLLGSPEDEPGRGEDEGPQQRVAVSAFWIGRCEVTWAEYQEYMELYKPLKRLNEFEFDTSIDPKSIPATVKTYLATRSPEVDAVTCPTPLYDSSFTYGVGEAPDQPAVTMTPFAAKQYAKWLSGITGRQYRLPTEAEWEYAARAGSDGAYSFGDEPGALADHAWFKQNSEERLHRVGRKAPNAWGLHDVHGNVAEWVLDQYNDAGYEGLGENNPVVWPTEAYPIAIRGGCWYEDADRLRCAARRGGDDEEWKLNDPSFPESPWWYTEPPTTGIGFRIVRPLAAMDADTMRRVWEAADETTELDVMDRLDEGRGVKASATPELSAALQAIRDE